MEKLKQKKMKVSESDPIPCDLLMDIFSRVPAKSIFRFRCLSKFWRSTLGLPYFTELFLTKSVSRPRILFAFKVDEELFFFSSPQPHNPSENSCLIATPYNKCFPDYFTCYIRASISGLVFHYDQRINLLMICNPVTGESITLPEVEATGIGNNGKSYFGYDPINKQFKVLNMEYRSPHTNWVLTLETGNNLIWRKTRECEPHSTGYGGICINGVLYYKAYFEGPCMIGCFDFSSEKFSFINFHEEMRGGTLVNYKGKIGALEKHECRLVLWVLEEDAGKHKWSKIIYAESPISLRKKMGTGIDIIGMTGAGEIVFSRHTLSKPFYIVYYNIERNTFTTVRIQGFEELLKCTRVATFVDYVENMKLL